MLNNNFIYKSAKTGWIISKKQATKVAGFGLLGYQYLSGMGLFWKPDGKNLYIADNNTDFVYHITLSVAWDITSTMTFVTQLGVGNEAQGCISGIFFSPDGSKMFVSSYASGTVSVYSLITAWTFTGYYSSVVQITLPGVSRSDSMSFTSDGLNVYTTDVTGGGKVYQHKLTTPFNLTTATLFKSWTLAGVRVACIKPDGTHLYVLFDYSMVDYKLTTKNDLSTAVSNDTTNVISGAWSTGLTFSPDGFNMYTVNSQYAQIYSAKLA